MVMLEVVHVTKRYRKVLANDDINLTIEDGRIGVLLGPNGAGKSTIIKCIMGFLKYQGQIQVNGLENKSIEAKKIMGYIPEIPSLYPNLTVDEHMEFIARAYKLKDYKAYKDALLERFDLTDKKKKFGDELSKGMQQKLSICCGLLPRPRLVLFDEPMIGLDPHAIKELKKVFEELRDSGCIRNLGVRVALDDFGTGYSSLNHIREMPLDVIKIDRCFIEHLGEDDFSNAFVRMVSELANAINVRVCVEGVETKRQRDIVKKMGIRMIQGFFYGKPMKIEEFEKKYLI